MIIIRERSYDDQMADGNGYSVYRAHMFAADRKHLGDYADEEAVEKAIGQSGEDCKYEDEHGDCLYPIS